MNSRATANRGRAGRRRSSRRRFRLVRTNLPQHAPPAFGLARLADVAPVQNQPVVRVAQEPFGATTRMSSSSTSRGVLPGAIPSRLATRNTWVSTAIVGSPNAVLRTTLAVLRPTPGRASSAARSRGVSPPCYSLDRARKRDDVPRLRAIKPDRLDPLGERLLAKRRHFLPAYRRRRNSARVALLTAGVGRLRRQHHGHQQREGIDVLEFALRGRHRPPTSARRRLGQGRSLLPGSFLMAAL